MQRVIEKGIHKNIRKGRGRKRKVKKMELVMTHFWIAPSIYCEYALSKSYSSSPLFSKVLQLFLDDTHNSGKW